MYGWRARVGVLIRAGDTVIEPELYRAAPAGVSFHFARMRFAAVAEEYMEDMEKEAERAAAEVAVTGTNLIIFGCTSASMLRGPELNGRLQEKLRAASGKAVITAATAIMEAIGELKIKRIAVATPYSSETNSKIKDFLEASGVKVTGICGLELEKEAAPSVHPVTGAPISPRGRCEPYVAYGLARRAFTGEAEGVLISCTGFRALEIIESLEEDLGRPVISSNQAILAAVLRHNGIRERIKGMGSLLSEVHGA